MSSYAKFVFLLYVFSFAKTQTPSICGFRTPTTCGYYLSHKPSDFNRANQICNFYDNSVLANNEVVSAMNNNEKMKWTGLQLSSDGSRWLWIGDGQSVPKEEEDKFFTLSREVNTVNDTLCIAVTQPSNKITKSYPIPCKQTLNESICQRRVRHQCHKWNFSYGCLWDDERCEHRYEEKQHDGDDGGEKCENRTGRKIFRMPCEFQMCTNCKLSIWSQWSRFNDTFNENSRYRWRTRIVLREAGSGSTSCNSFKLFDVKRNVPTVLPSSTSSLTVETTDGDGDKDSRNETIETKIETTTGDEATTFTSTGKDSATTGPPNETMDTESTMIFSSTGKDSTTETSRRQNEINDDEATTFRSTGKDSTEDTTWPQNETMDTESTMIFSSTGKSSSTETSGHQNETNDDEATAFNSTGNDLTMETIGPQSETLDADDTMKFFSPDKDSTIETTGGKMIIDADPGSSSSTYMIMGIAIVCVLLLLIIIVVVVLVNRRSKKKARPKKGAKSKKLSRMSEQKKDECTYGMQVDLDANY